MLLNLEGEGKGKGNQMKITLDIPTLFLDQNDYNLSVKSIFINASSQIEEQVCTLHTTAVDRNPFNLKQQIYEFETRRSDYIFSKSKHPIEYKIQLKDFHMSQFFLRGERELEGDFFIRILLEISRDVRIQ